MSAYSRAVLQFVHAVANRKGQGWARVHAFTFGTRLTNITRHLASGTWMRRWPPRGPKRRTGRGGRGSQLSGRVQPDWSRRVMGQGAVVILITDGLDRDPGEGLGAAMERLRLSARSVVWLNPLLRWEGLRHGRRGLPRCCRM